MIPSIQLSLDPVLRIMAAASVPLLLLGAPTARAQSANIAVAVSLTVMHAAPNSPGAGASSPSSEPQATRQADARMRAAMRMPRR